MHPHLKGNKAIKSSINTRIISGAMYAYDNESKTIIPEKERVNSILNKQKEIQSKY